MDISEYPDGEPLEKPLHAKKRRVWKSLNQVLGELSGVGEVPEAGDKLAGKAPEVGEVPVAGGAPGADKEPGPVTHSPASLPSPALPSTPRSSKSRRGAPGADQEPGSVTHSPASLPSPALPSTPRSSTSRSRKRLRPSHDAHIKMFLNYGSEPESDDSDEEFFSVPASSRVDQVVEQTPQDDNPDFVLLPAKDEATLMPYNFFDFVWTQFPSNIPAASRREPFSRSDVGPTSPCQDPYKVFVSIWNQEIMEHISAETNRYAQQIAARKMLTGTLSPNSRICDWKDTTPDELYTYFGIVIAMGIVIKTRIEEYWQSDNNIFSTPNFSAHMTLRRFQLLNNCLHFVNNEDMCAEELSPSEAKLFKIANVIEHLNKKFQELYVLEQNLALDESLLQWKGWLSINQFIRNKVATVGIKTYELCESQTGYLWRFAVHAQKNTSAADRAESQTPLEAATPSIVLRLLSGLEHRGHTIWMDNFYNSPALARYLKCLGFDVVGTLRTNRQFVPRELTALTKNDMKPGQITGLTSGDVDVIVWRDQNIVGTISTYHGNATSVSHDGKTKPIVILDYNVMMGGVDKKDQLLSMYPIERKRTNVWYKKFFRRLLNISVLNSHIITKKSGSSLTHRCFRRSLVLSLLRRHSKAEVKTVSQKLTAFDAKTHYIDEYPVGKNKSRLRRKCCVCSKLTHFYCVGCSKTVCICKCFVSIHS